jgi:DNA-binding NarL/FixJ family response regulator
MNSQDKPAGHNTIRVLVAHSHPVMRSALTGFLDIQDNMHCVGQAGSGPETVYRCRQLQPDLVLMDAVAAEMDAFATIQAIHHTYPHISTIAFVTARRADLVERVRTAGVTLCLGYLISVKDLLTAIRTVARPNADLSPLQPLQRISLLLREPQPVVLPRTGETPQRRS